MQKKTLWFLGILLSGCQYYQGNVAPDQPFQPSWPAPVHFEKTYPFLEMYNPVEIERMINDPREASCQFQTFSAFWEHYHGQWADTEAQTQKILNQSVCSLSHFGGTWLEALLYEDQQHWNKGLLTLGPVLKSPGNAFYPAALALSYRLEKARVTSQSDLSPSEIETITAQKNLLQNYQSVPENLSLPYNIVIILGNSPPKEFFESLILAFEGQSAIESVYIFSSNSPRSEILSALNKPQSVLIGYDLPHPLPKEYLMASQASITVGEDFVKTRNTDYWISTPTLQILESVLYDPFCVDPQIIFYEEDQISPKLLKFLSNNKPLMNVTGPAVLSTLSDLFALPQREEFFQKFFPKKIHYIPQANLLPHTILCLVRPETLRILNEKILEQGQSKILLLADPRALSGQPELDKSLNGVLFFTHPFDKFPQAYSESSLGSDLIEIVQRLPRFQEENYIYHGQLGAYFLKNQQIRVQRWWTRYRDLSPVKTTGGDDLKSLRSQRK